MERTVIKKQKAEGLFRETFADVIQQFGEANVFFCGRKMYIRINNAIISIEFAGTATAFSNVILTAMTAHGILDQNITPLSMLFTESKAKSGQDKLVNLRVILNVTGEYTLVWSCDLSDEDKMSLNDFVINYVELFSALDLK